MILINSNKKKNLAVILFIAAGFFLSLKTETASVIGKEITEFKLQNSEGKFVSLSDYKSAKGFIIIFTCNHCPFARLYPKRLNELNAKYGSLNIPLLAINPMDTLVYEDESLKNMFLKAELEKYNFPYLQDPLQTVSKQFEAKYTPQAFLVWKENNRWIIKYCGAIDDNGMEPDKVKNHYLSNVVDELLAGKSISIPETKAIGCAIYYRK
jgi:peroxiredoxin